MLNFNNKINCCGCTACKYICCSNAIEMQVDDEGFLYPVVNEELCTNCSMCTKVCPIQNDPVLQDSVSKKFAAKHINNEVRLLSTSGGGYTAFSDFVLNNGGVVYATAFNMEWNVEYVRITEKIQRDKSRGAKYVQSKLNDTFDLIKNDLLDGKFVMFIGPACYADGLRHFIHASCKQNQGRLFILDIICHGTPSPGIWLDNVKFLKSLYPSKWKEYRFRDKAYGWHGMHNTVIFETENTSESNTRELNAFTSLYSNGYISRPICHQCKYTNMKRPGDVTIGDCWGIEKDHADFDDGKGISLIMINSALGNQIFAGIEDQFDKITLSDNECVQPQLREPSKASVNREDFWKLYNEKGYVACIKKYTTYGQAKFIKGKIKNILGRG